MAAEQLQIEIKANVQDAVSNLKQIQNQLSETGNYAKLSGKSFFDFNSLATSALDRITSKVNSDVDKIIADFKSFDESVNKTKTGVQSLEFQFGRFGGILKNNAAKSLKFSFRRFEWLSYIKFWR